MRFELNYACLDVRSQEVLVRPSAWNRRKHYDDPLEWQRSYNAAYPAELQLATGVHLSLAKLNSNNPKTVAKWCSRTSVVDEPMGLYGRTSQHLFKIKNTSQLRCAIARAPC